MRQIYKDIIIGMILASFTFTPVAFAKPKATRLVKQATRAPLYTDLFKTVKKHRKNLKVSQLIESASPMVKKREMRDIKKLTLPFWDKKLQKFTVGKDYAKVKIGGQSLFIRYVDRGPVAFMVNKKPFLWKDVLIYSRAKARMTEIVTGKKRAKKVSFIESIVNDIFPKAYAAKKNVKEIGCEKIKGATVKKDGDTYLGCICPGDVDPIPANIMPQCRTEIKEEAVVAKGDFVGEPVVTGDVIIEEKKKSGGFFSNINPKILIGIGLAVLILLLLKKKNKKSGGSSTPLVPLPGWTPEPEGQCPTVGARGLTEADLPPECRKSSCADTNSCTDTNDGVIDGY